MVVRAIGSDLHVDYTAVGQTTHLADGQPRLISSLSRSKGVPQDVVARPAREPAQVGARELVVDLLLHRDALAAAFLVDARARHRGQERAVQAVMLAVVAQGLRLRLLDGASQPAEPGGQCVEGPRDLAVDAEPRDQRQHGHPEIGEPLDDPCFPAETTDPHPTSRCGPVRWM